MKLCLFAELTVLKPDRHQQNKEKNAGLICCSTFIFNPETLAENHSRFLTAANQADQLSICRHAAK